MIHPGLHETLAKLEAHFLADSRCAAMYLWGSLGKGNADSFSDVDVAIVIHDEHYQAVKSELQSVCERLCGPLLAWLPEGERPHTCNFAFLFAYDDEVLLYDCFLSSVTAAHEGPGSALKKVIFDHANLFETAQPAPVEKSGTPDSLSQDISVYWVYMYLNGKYYCRTDVFKMLYVQQVLFQTHLKILLAMNGHRDANWWARDVRLLSDGQQKELMAYFAAPDAQSIAQALWREMDMFARDARAACAQSAVEYPDHLEDGVRRHLRHMGVL